MSVIRRQSLLSSLFMYIGTILGAVNVMILFPKFLTSVEYGFITWLLILGSTIGIFARMGMRDITFKFFPYFKDDYSKDENTKHNSFLTLALMVPLIGVILGGLFIFLGKDFILQIYADNAGFQLIQTHFWLLFPLLLFDVYFNILNAYSTSLMKAAIPIFFRDLFVRLMILVLLLLFANKILTLSQFLIGYTSVYGLQCLGMIVYLLWLGEFRLGFDFSKVKELSKQILPYAGYAFLSGGAIYLVHNIDSLMVSESGLDNLAIFRVFSYLGILIMIPGRAIMNISLPAIANAWKEDNIAKIDQIYRKTASVQLVVGLGLLLLIWANIDHFIFFMEILKGDDEYAVGKFVALFIGLAKLVDGATGINGGIIVTSKHYRFDLFFVLLLIGLTISTNYFLIPLYGITGAAIATCTTAFIYNFGKFFFVKYKFGLQPFTQKTSLTVLIGALLFGLSYLLPVLDVFWIDLIYRSAILGGLYLAAILYFDLSPEISRLFRTILGKIGLKF